MRPNPTLITAAILIFGFALSRPARGEPAPEAAAPDSTRHRHSMEGMPGMEGMERMAGMHGDEHVPMTRHPLGFSHARFGSGTSWLPDESATHHLMSHAGAWTLMGHGVAFGGIVHMGGLRGDEKTFLPDMVMLMAERNGGAKSYWRVATMLSTDALTVGGAGYPLLFQTGETWNGMPLRDHQHPHNVFSEISGSMTRPISGSAAVSLYAAPVGEPALGPPAFPHRPVGSNDPLAPIGHHWQDATHIAYGVATVGLEGTSWRIEGSTFNGREPGENRAEIAAPKFDSFSGRASLNPARSLSLQISHGYLRRPEEAHPDHDAWRTTASAVWVRALGDGSSLDATLVWGRNRVDRRRYDSWLFEGEWSRDVGISPFARLEYVEKNAEELILPGAIDPERTFPLRQATLGAVVGLPLGGALSWGVGALVMANQTPGGLRPVYGDHPGGWSLYLRVRPKGGAHAMAM